MSEYQPRNRAIREMLAPNGPFRTCPVTTEAVALPLHSHLVAPDKPTVVAQTARKRRNLICYLTDLQWHDAVFLLKCAPSTGLAPAERRFERRWRRVRVLHDDATRLLANPRVLPANSARRLYGRPVKHLLRKNRDLGRPEHIPNLVGKKRGSPSSDGKRSCRCVPARLGREPFPQFGPSLPP